MKLLNLQKSHISESFLCILEEGKKADWIAANQGPALMKKIKQNNDTAMHGKTAEEIGEYLFKQGGKFSPFYAKLYLNGDVKRMEDMYRLKPLVDGFQKHKQHLKNKDISSYTLAALTKALEPYTNKISHKHVDPKQDERFYMAKKMTKLIDSPNFEVVVPHTVEASVHLGKGTNWCTATGESCEACEDSGIGVCDEHEEGVGDNMFDHYNQDGDLYVIRAGKRRFQLHYDSNQFMDEKDQEVSEKDIAYLSEFPSYKKFLDMMIKKHYFNKEILTHDYRPQK